MQTKAEKARNLQELFGDVEELPTLPAVVAKISQMTVSPQTNAADIGKLISNDPALSSKILRLVNSSYYGFPRKINSVTKAIVLLGFSKVKNMAISAAVVDVFRASGNVDGFDFMQYWRHAVASAVAAEAAARKLAPALADDAFVGALLADTGKALCAVTLPDRYTAVLQHARQTGLSMAEAERTMLGFTNREAGAMLAESWNFPELLVESIRHAASPDAASKDRTCIELVHAGCCIAAGLGILGAGEQRVPELSDAAWRSLKLTEEVLDEIMRDYLRGFDNAGAILDLAG